MRKPTKEEIDNFKKAGFKIEDCTCNNCPINDKECWVAFDLYNTNDDCLWEK